MQAPALLLIQLPDDKLGNQQKTDQVSGCLGTDVGDPKEDPGSWPQSGSALATWGVNSMDG